ncbi:MAG TPA: hypothetical protein VIZ43_29460 [Trebonia sp.]
MDPFGPVRTASELLAERTLERVLDLVLQAVDVNEVARQVDVDTLLSRVDLNELLSRIDLDEVLGRVDLDRLLSRVDVNRLIARVDVDALVEHTEVGAVIMMSSRHVGNETVDLVRGQAVTLDRVIDRWVRRLLRRPAPGLAAPPAPLNAGAQT